MTHPVSSVRFHQRLIADERRTRAYRDAILARVRPGDVVMDAGSGTGLLGFFACQAGASRIYSVERTEMIEVARRLAEANGLQDRMIFVHADLAEVQLPEPVSVIVSELLSKAVYGQGVQGLVERCRDRFLEPDGRVIPESTDLHVAPVESAEGWESLSFPPLETFDIDFSYAAGLNLHWPDARRFSPDDLLAPGEVAKSLDFTSGRVSAPTSPLRFRVERQATLHGLCAWFVACLAPGVELSSAPPGLPSWDQAFFPLLEPVPVEKDDLVEVTLGAIETEGGGVIWRWSTRVGRQSRTGSSEEIASFDQTTFHASPVSRLGLLRRTEGDAL